jgi:hypothetical protein
MTREEAVAGLISRIKRDQGYLAYRKACNRRMSYVDQVQLDMQALALAAPLLEKAARLPQSPTHSIAAAPAAPAAPVVPAIPPMPPTPASPVDREAAGRSRQNEKISTARARTKPGTSSVAKR